MGTTAKPLRVELTGATLVHGPHAGEEWFFVEVIELESRFGVWDGPSYEAALTILARWQRDGAKVRDLFGEGPA